MDHPVPLLVLSLLLCGFGSGLGFAQQPSSSSFHPSDVWTPAADLRSVTSLRTGSGRPGPKYWQNHVAYTIEAQLDTSSQLIEGRVELTYTNNSPTPLSSIWLSTGGAPASPVEASSSQAPIRLLNISRKQTKNGSTLSTYSTGTRTQIRLSSPIPTGGGPRTRSPDYQHKD